MKKLIIPVAMILAILCMVTCFAESKTDPAAVAAGDLVTFGSYAQDSDPGKEPIEWIVLDVQDGKALLLSRYGLYAAGYHNNWDDCTWETCSLRAWLNSTFLDLAFSAEEQSAILVSTVDNSASQGYDWTQVGGEKPVGGNNTQDKVFLLSYAEADRYLEVPADRGSITSRVAPTAFAITVGAEPCNEFRTADGDAAGCWWLRTNADSLRSAEVVFPDGSISYTHAYHRDGIVRPALWLDLNSGID